MTNDERNPTPETEDTPESALPEDDTRYAPPLESSEAIPEVVEIERDSSNDEPLVHEVSTDINLAVTDDMDIEAALAAVSTLSDMLAEQEAAEQARIAQAEAEAQAAAERQARLEHPEQFFPVPPMSVLHRGQMASVLPALLLIGVGAWLTFILTTTKTMPDTSLILGISMGGLALVLLVRWLTAGRWTQGVLFDSLAVLLSAGLLVYLLQPASPGLMAGWPLLLVVLGIALALTGLLAFPRNTRLLLPGIILVLAGAIGWVVSNGLLSDDFVNAAAGLWPVALVIVALIWLLPLIFRQRS